MSKCCVHNYYYMVQSVWKVLEHLNVFWMDWDTYKYYTYTKPINVFFMGDFFSPFEKR